MNHTIDDARQRLREYADWRIHNEAVISGWGRNRCSVESRAMDGGAKSTKGRPGLTYWRLPGYIRQMHGIYQSLPTDDTPSLQQMIFFKYIAPRRNSEGQLGCLTEGQILRAVATDLNVSVTTIRQAVARAEEYVRAQLNAK